MAVVDEELREQLFADAPAEADLWMGDVNDVGGEREIVPFRFGGLDFWVIFASPHAEADHDDDLLKLFMDTLDVRDFEPDEQSRLIKFCRCDARQNHFIAKDWKLSETSQIFQFLDVLRTILDMYFRASPEHPAVLLSRRGAAAKGVCPHVEEAVGGSQRGPHRYTARTRRLLCIP